MPARSGAAIKVARGLLGWARRITVTRSGSALRPIAVCRQHFACAAGTPVRANGDDGLGVSMARLSTGGGRSC